MELSSYHFDDAEPSVAGFLEAVVPFAADFILVSDDFMEASAAFDNSLGFLISKYSVELCTMLISSTITEDGSDTFVVFFIPETIGS